MACEIIEKRAGHLTLRVSGRLKRKDLSQAERVAIEVMRSGGKVRFFLLLAENFEGWDPVGDWGDLTFQSRFDEQIERIAIVGEKRWQQLAEAFVGKGLRSVDIRYFTPNQAAVARAWIASGAAPAAWN
jgi:hypothetical protein